MRLPRTHFLRGAVAAAAAALVLGAAACSPGTDDEGNGDEGEVESGDLVLGTGSTGGTYYPLGGEIARVWSETIEDVNVSVNSTGASVENIRSLATGDANLVMSINGTANAAANGADDFADDGQDYSNLRFLGNIYHEVLHIVVSSDSGIETIEDMEGKNIAIGPGGSGTAVAAEKILGLHDLTVDDINASQDGFGDAANALKDGTIDAAFAILASPAESINDVYRNSDVEMFSFAEEDLAALMEMDSSYAQFEIPADTYEGQSEAAVTVTNWAALYGTTAISEDLAYELTSTMYEQAGEMTHAVAGELVPETSAEAVGDVEIHAGSQRYFEEVGAV